VFRLGLVFWLTVGRTILYVTMADGQDCPSYRKLGAHSFRPQPPRLFRRLPCLQREPRSSEKCSPYRTGRLFPATGVAGRISISARMPCRMVSFELSNSAVTRTSFLNLSMSWLM
jgi:hypothetical protein